MNIDDYNSAAWDHEVEKQTEWTRPVSEARIADARKGNFSIVLTPQIPVPAEWFPPLQGADVLCLACGGGQQSPVLAAAGANVTVLDNSEKQLGQDRLVAEREGLDITLVKGDMRDLSVFDDSSFDLIFHPVSNGYISDVRPVWLESFRVLRPGGSL
ncbi:MAG: class I SAM-dependent methyltransferase, partial [Phycisphaerae bacterium]